MRTEFCSLIFGRAGQKVRLTGVRIIKTLRKPSAGTQSNTALFMIKSICFVVLLCALAGCSVQNNSRLGHLQDNLSKLSDEIAQLSLVVSNQTVEINHLRRVDSTNVPAPDKRPSDFVILKAVYGVSPTDTVDVTEEVRSLAKNGSIDLHPQWALGIDPAYGKTKRVTVAYRYNGQIEVASFDQYQEFDIPLLPKTIVARTAAAP